MFQLTRCKDAAFVAASAGGAPGAPVTVSSTPFNPMRLLVRTWIEVSFARFEEAAGKGLWVFPPTPTPGAVRGPQPVPSSPLVPFFPIPVRKAKAAALASSRGWNGSRGVQTCNALYEAMNAALAVPQQGTVTVPESQVATIVAAAPAVYQLFPGPVSAQALSVALQVTWNAREEFAGSDSSKRANIASIMAHIAVEFWDRVNPVCPTVGTPGSPTVAPPTLPVRLVTP